MSPRAEVLVLVKLPDKGVWRDPDGVTEHIDTWGALSMDEAIAQAQQLVGSHGDVGDTYELLEVTVRRRVVVRAERVGVVQQ